MKNNKKILIDLNISNGIESEFFVSCLIKLKYLEIIMLITNSNV